MAEQPGTQSGFAPLRDRNFRLLFASLIAGQALVPLQFIGGIFWIQDNASEDVRVILIGLIGAIRGIGGLGFGLFGGALADRFDRRKLIMVTQGAAAVIAILTGILMGADDGSTGGLVIFFALTTVAAAFWAIDIPTRQSMVPELVGPRLAPSGISLSTAGMQLSMPVALFASGMLVDAIGHGPTFALSSIGHITAVTLMAFLVYEPSTARTPGRYSAGHALRDARDGIRHARQTPLAWSIILLMVTTMGLGMPAVTNLGPTWITTVADVPVRYFGLIAMWWGIAALTTSLLLTRLVDFRAHGRVLCGAMVLFVAAFSVFSTGTIWGALAGNIGMGAATAAAQVTAASLVQHLVPNEVRGRVMSLLFMNLSVAQAMAFPLALVAQATSLRALLPVLAVILALNVARILLRQRQIWNARIEHEPLPGTLAATAPAAR